MHISSPKKIYLFVLIFFSILLFPLISHAETHIYSDDVRPYWAWDKEGSPYILEEPIYVPDGSQLYIGAGVEVVSAPNEYEEINSLTFDGDLTVSGTKDSPVKFKDLYSIYLSNSNSTIKNAVFDGTGIDFFKSTTTIEDITIRNAFKAINAKGSKVNILRSTLVDNNYGVASYNQGPVFQVRAPKYTGGIGNALDTEILDPTQNVIVINESSVINNKNFGILNQTNNIVDATNNWWGTPEGPTTEISGPVIIAPWKDKEPEAVDSCCSNVLFLPGIEASRLYKDTNMLWEPNRNDDVRKMFMDSQGVSIDSSIHTSDIISSAYGAKDIYKSFIASMNGLVDDGSINEWKPFPYDWRKGAYDIVDKNMLDEVGRLASTSQTGKIIIIAHSNGGLVAKALMNNLEQKGLGDLIENIIFVAVPELGTPQSILSMLHGHNQSLIGGLALTSDTARTFSQNLPGAYGLLPSRKFFESKSPTVISDFFQSNSEVSSFDGMKKFLVQNTFSKSSTTDINIPLLLNSYILSLADSFHSLIDKWKPSGDTKILSILGWGMPTSKSVIYEKDKHCLKGEVCQIAYSPEIIDSGDGTVMTASASGNANETLFFNLRKFKDFTHQNINHANILEASALQNLLKGQITKSQSETEKYFTTAEPVDTNRWLVIKIFSPIDIDIYDDEGNHTGLIENPTLGQDLFEENIPSSYYGDFGRIKMVRVPYNENYQIALKGNDAGVFSVDAEVTQNDEVIASTTFSEMPVTPLLNVDLIIATSTIAFATSSVMYMDVDGDGTADLTSRPNTNIDILTYIESMRKVIIALKLPLPTEKVWLNRIDKIAQVVSKNNSKKFEKTVNKVLSKKFTNKSISESQKNAILKTFAGLLSYIENNTK